MELPWDVPDLPACLTRWNQRGSYDAGLLTVPSCDDLPCWKSNNNIFVLDNEDESCSGLSLSSSHSNASSAINTAADLGLNFEYEFFDDVTVQTSKPAATSPSSTPPSIISTTRTSSAPPSPHSHASLGNLTLPLKGALSLKLDTAAVASTWRTLSGNAAAFSLPRSAIAIAAASIPSTAARAASLAVDAQQGWNMGPVCASGRGLPPPYARERTSSPPTTILNRNMTMMTMVSNRAQTSVKSVTAAVLPSHRPSAPRPTPKRVSPIGGGSGGGTKRKSGKSSDKRPRIKGRFVRRDELEQFKHQVGVVGGEVQHPSRLPDESSADETASFLFVVVPDAATTMTTTAMDSVVEQRVW